MQEEHSPQPQPRNWLVLAGGLGVAILLCLLGGTLAILAASPPALPTRVSPAVVEVPPITTPVLSAGQPTVPPLVAETPAAPQSGGRSAGDPYIIELGNTGYDVQHYTLRLALDPAQPTVEGTTIIEAVATFHGLAQLSLDFIGFEVASVTVNGAAADFARQGKKLIVNLPAWLPAGAPFTLAVAYQGQPAVEQSPYLGFVDHLGLHYPDGNSLFTIAEPDGARYWFPANDHPLDKATFRFELVVPAGLTAVANGQLLETRPGLMPDGRTGELFIWEHNHPMATYLAVVVVGRYQRLDSQSPGGVPLRHYVFPGLQTEFEEANAITGEAIDWMGDLFGPYPFEAFGLVTVQLPGASMETQTMVLLSDGMIGRRTIAHELAHMWFGDWVSLESWASMWRNEGFATYTQILWETRGDPEALELQMEGVRSAVEGNDENYPIGNPPPGQLFEFNIYYKGALFVHALRQEMGDEAFFRGLRLYLERYGGGTASDAEFQATMEEAAGIPLDTLFTEWLAQSQ
ncbi:MAG: hypothetical protein L0322_27805 [Chloroflexi bacterium]|nr:hypothetical protein [Chloroflexota bacterium]